MTAQALIRGLQAQGLTVATCESLTGGMICAALVDVPGASRVVRGGLITYQTDTKSLLAGVDAGLIETHGVVSAEVARAMAAGARVALQADLPVRGTGVASPGEMGDPPAGTVFVGLASAAGVQAVELHLTGDRQAVRQQTVDTAIKLIGQEIGI